MWIQSLQNITSKKIRKIQKHFLATIFFKIFFHFFFFVWPHQCLQHIYCSSKSVKPFSRKTTFKIFLSLSITLKKIIFQGYHWEKFYFTSMRTHDRNFKLIRTGADFLCLPGYALWTNKGKRRKGFFERLPSFFSLIFCQVLIIVSS